MRRVLVVVAVLLSTCPARGETIEPVRVDRWLQLAPVDVPWPAFHAENEDHALKLEDLLDVATRGQEHVWPAAGDAFHWSRNASAWTEVETTAGTLDLGEPEDTPRLALAAAYVTVDRFTKLKLAAKSPQLLRVFVDEEKVADKKEADTVADDEDADETEVGETSGEVELVTGKHRILVATLADPDGPDAWTLRAELTPDDGDAAVVVGLDADHALRFTDLLDVQAVTGVAVSGDGGQVAVSMRYPAPNADFARTWIDLRDARSGQVVRSFQGVGDLGSFRWDPRQPGRFAFVSSDDGKTTLWVGDVDGGPHRAVLEGIEHFGDYRWAEDTLVYSVSEEPKPKHEGIKRYEAIPDRWSNFRSKSYLYQVPVDGGGARRLTAGETTTTLQDVSPDGDRLLFTRTTYTDDRWPFSSDELFELDLQTLQARSIHEAGPGLSARYSPDGEKLVVLGSPTIFGDVGLDVPEGTIPNEYDGQAYIYDLETGGVTAFTRKFDPAVDDAQWLADGRIVLRVTDGSTERLVMFDARKSHFETLDTPLDVVSDVDASADGKVLAFWGTGLNVPQHVYTMSPKRGAKPSLVLAVEHDRFERIVPGDVEDFDFQKDDGTTIEGRVYTPPDFDPSRTYPAIVYYYGGTLPVDRSFGGRYPKELWAAQGYVVYVLQPSGATGFGQEYSSRHVNDWGKTTVGEIVQGTKIFLDKHPYVDPGKVGCIGASFGGFMTELLVTETDIFSAAVAHAGISSISSYWGEGWWGHLYSAAATAHSYPWNRPDVYVDQSPLFHADKVNTPLLLLHGGDDNNVPPGESEQMYSALRVLGKDVEFVRIAGERHWILDYDKRKIWGQTIMAWFDWKLKGQPQWWDSLYAEKNKE